MAKDNRPPGRIVTFYSYKGGAGRTMALANTAWIMASNGLRVLAVDWDLESPGLHRYFHPFLRDKHLRSPSGVIELIRDYAVVTMTPHADADNRDWIDTHARILRHAASLQWQFPGDGTIDFVPAGQQDRTYSKTVSTFDWDNFFDRQGGGVFLEALGDNMRREYDYVLIDSRTGVSDTAGICTVQLPDVVVNCFTMSTQSIEGAAAVSRSIRNQRGRRLIKLIPVPMRVEEGEKGKLEAGRDYARLQFETFLDWLAQEEIDKYWGDVEVPYKPFYAYEEILAPFGDRSHQEGSLLAAFERLTSVITDGHVQKMAPIGERDRRRYLDEFERTLSTAFGEILIAYASVDRMWAEWVAAEVSNAGLRARLQAVDLSPSETAVAELEETVGVVKYVVVLLSQDYIKSPNALHLWKMVAGRDPVGGRRFLVPIRLDTVRLPASFTERNPTDLAGVVAERAREVLREALDLPPAAGDVSGDSSGDTYRPRFPGTQPPLWKVPQRNTSFTGRDFALQALRDRLSANVTVVVPQALHGLGGVGKTQIAVEYAYRFAADYDIVWWVAAEQPTMARSDMAELALALKLPASENIADSVRVVLEALREGRPYRRWLLVFDNADDPDQLRDLIPHGPGHVLLTSRNQAWARHASAVEVGVFDRAESVAFLRARVTGLTDADADRVAEKLGDLPLAIEEAGAWLAATAMSVERYMELLDTQLAQVLDEGRPTDYPTTAAATWLVSLDRLREQTPAAAKLLELCAFFAPEPIPLSLLFSNRFVSMLAGYDASLRDPILQGRVIREIGRYALARPDSEQSSIQMHRLVQVVIRGQLSPEEEAKNLRQVCESLAAANPRDPDHPESWPTYAQLWPHVRASGVLDWESHDARQLVADLVRYQLRRGDFDSSQQLAEDALARWLPVYGPDDLTILVMQFHRANALRAQANYATAREIDEDVRSRLDRLVGANHEYTLMTARALAADLRAVGEYARARDLDNETVPRFREVFGTDHPQTLMATNNLAVSLRMVGDFRGATELDGDIHQRRRALLGESNPYTLWSASNYGRDLRDIGDLVGSRTLLEATLGTYRQVVGDDHLDTLRTAKNLAVTLRKLGEFAEAHQLTLETWDRYRLIYGTNHPETLACEMTLLTTHSAVGDNSAARLLGAETLDKLYRVLAEAHTYTLACRNNLSIVIRKDGEHATARALSEQTVALIGDSLGEEHPYVAFAALNLANDLRVMGEVGAARQMDEQMYARVRHVLGEDNMDTISAAHNLSLSLQADGDTATGRPLYEDALTRARFTMGKKNPRRTAAERGEPANFYIEPPPP
ncbi:MAG: FxSxx-COOH system tetratricopeptide repeat protein [Pseudonocardiaceae bacterium]